MARLRTELTEGEYPLFKTTLHELQQLKRCVPRPDAGDERVQQLFVELRRFFAPAAREALRFQFENFIPSAWRTAFRSVVGACAAAIADKAKACLTVDEWAEFKVIIQRIREAAAAADGRPPAELHPHLLRLRALCSGSEDRRQLQYMLDVWVPAKLREVYRTVMHSTAGVVTTSAPAHGLAAAAVSTDRDHTQSSNEATGSTQFSSFAPVGYTTGTSMYLQCCVCICWYRHMLCVSSRLDVQTVCDRSYPPDR